MHFAVIIATVFAASAVAAPSSLDPRQQGQCDIKKCAAAMGPTGVACGFSVTQGLFDPLFDLPCAALLINSYENTPDVCHGCQEIIKEKAPQLEEKFAFLKGRIDQFLHALGNNQTTAPA